MTRATTDPTYIKELAQVMEAHNLSRIAVNDGAELVMERGSVGPMPTRPADKVVEVIRDTQNQPSPEIVSAAVASNAPSSEKDIVSPMVGVFYAAPSPEAEAFVRIGDQIKKGDVLCIIEAMKLMNEVTAEFDCKIIDICVGDGDVAEFGQVLFKVE